METSPHKTGAHRRETSDKVGDDTWKDEVKNCARTLADKIFALKEPKIGEAQALMETYFRGISVKTKTHLQNKTFPTDPEKLKLLYSIETMRLRLFVYTFFRRLCEKIDVMSPEDRRRRILDMKLLAIFVWSDFNSMAPWEAKIPELQQSECRDGLERALKKFDFSKACKNVEVAEEVDYGTTMKHVHFGLQVRISDVSV